MNAAKSEENNTSTDSKPKLLTRIKQSPVTDKATKAFALVGVATVVVLGAAKVSKKSGVKFESTLPSADVTITDA